MTKKVLFQLVIVLVSRSQVRMNFTIIFELLMRSLLRRDDKGTG